jgi:hypothetical protein
MYLVGRKVVALCWDCAKGRELFRCLTESDPQTCQGCK